MTDKAPNSILHYRGFLIWIERREHQAIVYRQVNNRQCSVKEHHFSPAWTDKQLIAFAMARVDEAWNTWERYRRAIRGEDSMRGLEE